MNKKHFLIAFGSLALMSVVPPLRSAGVEESKDNRRYHAKVIKTEESQ